VSNYSSFKGAWQRCRYYLCNLGSGRRELLPARAALCCPNPLALRGVRTNSYLFLNNQRCLRACMAISCSEKEITHSSLPIRGSGLAELPCVHQWLTLHRRTVDRW